MAEPIVIAALSFFTVIVIGTLLVVINDWLEVRLGGSANGSSAVQAAGVVLRPARRWDAGSTSASSRTSRSARTQGVRRTETFSRSMRYGARRGPKGSSAIVFESRL